MTTTTNAFEYRTPVGAFTTWEEAAEACERCDFDPVECVETIEVDPITPNEAALAARFAGDRSPRMTPGEKRELVRMRLAVQNADALRGSVFVLTKRGRRALSRYRKGGRA